jgi:CheY-like chemotaxis protein
MGLIAIVDDSRLARTFNAAALKKLGHEILQVEPTSLGTVLGILRERKPDLLLMDYLMPDCPGPALARACFEDEVLGDMKLVMLTAHREEEEVHGDLEMLGVKCILHKPADPKAIEEVINALMGA